MDYAVYTPTLSDHQLLAHAALSLVQAMDAGEDTINQRKFYDEVKTKVDAAEAEFSAWLAAGAPLDGGPKARMPIDAQPSEPTRRPTDVTDQPA